MMSAAAGNSLIESSYRLVRGGLETAAARRAG
jgi:hypothetical protein